MGNHKVVFLLSVFFLFSCSEQMRTSFKLTYEKAQVSGVKPGENLLSLYNDIAGSEECKNTKGLRIVKDIVRPSVVEKGEKLNHHMVYVVCSADPVKGKLYRIIKREGKVIMQDYTPQEFKPGKWSIDVFVVIPQGAPSGSYSFESLVEIRR